MSIADTREDKRRLEVLRRAGWQIATLHYGDYEMHEATGRIVLVEHKTISKMITDMRNGVLIRQCRGVIEHSDFPILMVEGHWIQQAGSLLGSGITWEQAWNQLQTIQDMGCRLQLTSSISHSLERLFQLEAYYKKEKHDSALRQLSGDPYIVVLSLIDGIDEGKARMLEASFPTLHYVMGQEVEELQKVKGIGEVIARRIYTFFRTDYIENVLSLWDN